MSQGPSTTDSPWTASTVCTFRYKTTRSLRYLLCHYFSCGFYNEATEVEHQAFWEIRSKVSSAPACFTSQGKSEVDFIYWLPGMVFPGDQIRLYDNCDSSLISYWSKEECRLLSEGTVQTQPTPLFDSSVWGFYIVCDVLCMLARAQAWLAGTRGSAAAEHPFHFMAFHSPWWHPQGHLMKSAKLFWHWRVELLPLKKKILPDLITTAASMLLWFPLPSWSSSHTHLSSAQVIRYKVKNTCKS